jgi:flavin-dependent dehydrogenase
LADFDVLIAGGGPGGCATAISLAHFAPRLRVGLIDAPVTGVARIGETVPPQIAPMLRHLELSQNFAADRHHASYRTLSAWGEPALLSNEFLLQVQQTGWRLDRARFDAMMLGAAARRATVIMARVVKLDHVDGAWRMCLGDGVAHTARTVVDASGRAAVLARLRGVRVARLDRLVSAFAFCENRSGEGCLTIEAVPEGWWYTAALPDARRIIAFMSDSDIARRHRATDRDGWLRALRATEHIRAIVADAAPDTPRLQGAGSQLTERDRMPTLISVGDAASCFDPLSGQGIVKALRSGVFASYAIADHLERGDSDGLRRYAAFIQSEFSAYRGTLRDYYARERRWPEAPFWARRRNGAHIRNETAAGALAATPPS